MNQSADDLWQRILNGIGLELQTPFNVLNDWADILDEILDPLPDDEVPVALLETPPLTADELLDDIRDAIKRFAHLEDQLRDEFRKTYGDQGSHEA